jgi:ABC-type uncharacterized transport system ATPase subunit
VLLHGIVFVIDHSNVITVLQRTVVVKGGELGEIRADRSLPESK